jgi:hypothetical protein
VQLSRIDLDLDDREVVRTLSAIHVWPLDLAALDSPGRVDIVLGR